LICFLQWFGIELKNKKRSNREWKKATQEASSGGSVSSVGATLATEKSSAMLLLNWAMNWFVYFFLFLLSFSSSG
jgi:hypothetical protein